MKEWKIKCSKCDALKPYVIITIKLDTTGIGLVSRAQAAFLSVVHRLYGFNYSLTYRNIFVSTCISPTLLNKNKRKGPISMNFKLF